MSLRTYSSQNEMIPVTCAIIEDEDTSSVLCAQRSEQMKLPLKWEFPGGKVEEGESPEACLVREIQEELGVRVEVIEQLPSNVHTYPGSKAIELIPFRCRISGGQIQLKEHRQIRWLKREALPELDWAEADIPVVSNYLQGSTGTNIA